MISKKHRLSQREVKKVLRLGKPFFSYGIVLNYTNNQLSYNRYALVVWAKSVINNVQRNFFSRRFYHIHREYLEKEYEQWFYDCIFVVKKQTKLDRDNQESVSKFLKDISFLISKIKK